MVITLLTTRTRLQSYVVMVSIWVVEQPPGIILNYLFEIMYSDDLETVYIVTVKIKC